jgi:hypothetical protein
MKPSQLLSLCGALVAAQDFSPQHVGVGICRSPAISANPIFPDLALCSRDGVVLEYDDANPSSWTYTKPCYRNNESEYCIFSSSSFADNRGVSILTTRRRAGNMMQQPAFTHPEELKGINQDIIRDETPVYKVIPIPGKDLGVVATKPLNTGDHIMSNTASVMIDYGAFEVIPTDEIRRLQAVGVDYLPPAHRTRLMNLSTHSHIAGHHRRVEKILATNAFDIDNDDGEDYSFYVVFPESKSYSRSLVELKAGLHDCIVSRMNHDCRPNADYHYDPDTLTQHVHAVRPIAMGEEITISYLE